MKSHLYALSTQAWLLPPTPKSMPTMEATAPTSPTPLSTPNTRLFSITPRDLRPLPLEERSSDGSFSLLLSEEQVPSPSCKRTLVATRRSLLSARTKEPWHNRWIAISFRRQTLSCSVFHS